MKIRLADKFDFPEVYEMIKDFSKAAPLEIIRTCDINEQDFNSLYMTLMAGAGLVLIAEKNNQVCGLIMGGIEQNIWDRRLLTLKELAFWVKPEYRNTRAGYLLLKTYCEEAQELRDNGRIHMYTMAKMTNSPDIKYEKFGYFKVEEVWVAGTN